MTRVWTDGYGGLALDAANLNAMEADIAAARAGSGAPLWQAATNYNAGQAVISPSGQLVTAKVTFTSGATFNAPDWKIVPVDGGSASGSSGTSAVGNTIRLRRDTAANWTSTNPVLGQGEFGLETDTSRVKIGDGSTAWASLGYPFAKAPLLVPGSPLVQNMLAGTVMASPPTITATSTNPAAFTQVRQAANYQWNPWTGFRISGGPLDSNRNPIAISGTAGWPICIEFDMEGDQFAFRWVAKTTNAFRLWANEQQVASSSKVLSTVSGATAGSDLYFTVNFGSRAYRRIRLEIIQQPNDTAPFEGITFAPTTAILPPSIQSPRVHVCGDSYGYGIGADFASRTVTDGVTTASSTTVTSATANFVSADVGQKISGGSIPAGATISSVTNSTTIVISSAATASATAVALTVSDANTWDSTEAWPIQFGRALGIADVWNWACKPSTGFLAVNSGNDNYAQRYSSMLPYVRPGDIVILQGSINDGGFTASAITNQVVSDVAWWRTNAPKAYLLLTSPLYVKTPTSAHINAYNAMNAAASTTGVSLLDALNPNQLYFYGTGDMHAPTGDGPADYYATANEYPNPSQHPSVAGHQAIGKLLAAQAYRALYAE